MAGLILAAINPDNTAHGYNWTFVYPMLLFIIVAGVLYYLFGRPHRRVPPQPISAMPGSRPPGPGAARSAAVAGGLSSAAGGGTTESPAEPQGAHLAPSDDDARATATEAGGTATAGTASGGATATAGPAAEDSAAEDSAAGDTEAQE